MALSTPSEPVLADAAESIPVLRLGYSDPAVPGETLAVALMKTIVAMAAAVAAMDLVRAASVFWIQFSPTPMRGVGTGWQPGTWPFVAGLGLEGVLFVASVPTVAGAVQFFRRRPLARTLLLWGAAGSLAASVSTVAGAVQFFRRRPLARNLLLWGATGSLAASVASFALSLVTYSLTKASGYDMRSAFILAVWRVHWVLGPMVPLLLLLLTLIRPEIKRWLSRQS